MSEIECLHCQKILKIPKFVDIKSYDGEIKCKNCGARLAIKFTGSVKPVKYKLVEKPPHKNASLITPIQFVPAGRPTKNE